MISTAEEIENIVRIFFSVAQVCQVIAGAFGASWFKVAVVFGLPVSLAVCTLGNVSFIFERFEFYFVLFYVFDIQYIFYYWGQVLVRRKAWRL
jgi:hypothetical protein